jgi:MFS family permease
VSELNDDQATDATEEHDKTVDLRETYRQQLLDSIGGWQGTVITAIAPIVFVVVNATANLRAAIIAAIATSVALTVYRLVRKQSIQQALSGLFGVVVAALIAARTGQARGYFLLGIWQSFAYAVPFALSIPIRRPLVGWLWEFLDPTPYPDGEPEQPWYRRRGLLKAYMISTAFAAALFLARGIVQAALYHEKATGWLAFARIAMGYPLFVVVLGASYWVVRRARAPYLASDSDASAEDGAVNRGFSLRKSEEQ